MKLNVSDQFRNVECQFFGVNIETKKNRNWSLTFPFKRQFKVSGKKVQYKTIFKKK